MLPSLYRYAVTSFVVGECGGQVGACAGQFLGKSAGPGNGHSGAVAEQRQARSRVSEQRHSTGRPARQLNSADRVEVQIVGGLQLVEVSAETAEPPGVSLGDSRLCKDRSRLSHPGSTGCRNSTSRKKFVQLRPESVAMASQLRAGAQQPRSDPGHGPNRVSRTEYRPAYEGDR